MYFISWKYLVIKEEKDMEKKLYCYNCDKDVKPLDTIQNNMYVVRHQQVHVAE